MLKNISMPVVALALGHLVTDLQAGALPIVLPHLNDAERNIVGNSAAVWLYYG